MKFLALAMTSLLGFSAIAEVYTPQEAFQDLSGSPLEFVGREYPNADLGPGGNYVCIYKNSRVYVRHEGCRPAPTQRLAVFSAKIVSRNGGLVEIYIEDDRKDYRLADAGPQMNGTWRLTTVDTPEIMSELSFRNLITLEKTVWPKIFNTCTISKSSLAPDRMPETKCYGDASDPQGNLETVWHDPHAHGLREAHDLILKAPRK